MCNINRKTMPYSNVQSAWWFTWKSDSFNVNVFMWFFSQRQNKVALKSYGCTRLLSWLREKRRRLNRCLLWVPFAKSQRWGNGGKVNSADCYFSLVRRWTFRRPNQLCVYPHTSSVRLMSTHAQNTICWGFWSSLITIILAPLSRANIQAQI